MWRIRLFRNMGRRKGEGDRLQEGLRRRRVVRPADAPDPFALTTAGSTPLYHVRHKLTTQHASQLALEILYALLPPLALVHDERDALWQFWRAAREHARGPRQERLGIGKMVQQARPGEEVVPRGSGRRRGCRGWEQE